MTHLIRTRRFFPLLITQFLGAFNDNLFKNALLTFIAVNMSEQSDLLSNLIAGLFILPFFLFSAMAGELADKYFRNRIAVVLKLTELFLMCGVAVAYFMKSLPLLIVLIACMGAQSAFFGPVKYALLPQQLRSDELIEGNAFIEASTYGAILLGLIIGTLVPMPVSIALLILLAAGGLCASRLILTAPAPRPELRIHLNPLVALKKNYIFLRKHHFIFQSILGASWFWIIGAFAAVQIYPLCGKIISAGNGTMTFFLVLFSLGVAAGSYACARLLKGAINLVYVPLSALLMALCLFGLWGLSSDYPKPDHLMSLIEFWQAPRAFALSLCLFLLAFFGGLYIIPLNAFMQKRAPTAYTATVIAGNNIFNALGMVGVAVLSIVCLKIGFSLPQLFGIMGFLSLLTALYICTLLPDYLTRSVLQTVLRLLFRTRLEGIENFYAAGKRVLIIANHVSLWDGILLAAFMPERLTFAITSAWTGRWFMPIVRLAADFYPLDPTNPLSIRKLIELLKSGQKVMIFPEGRITLTGKIMQVYEGAALTALRADAKILPVRINGAEYSSLSYVTDKFKSCLFPHIDLHILEPVRLKSDAETNHRGQVGRRLYRLMTEAEIRTTAVPTHLYTALKNRLGISDKKKTLIRQIEGQTLSLRQFIGRSGLLAETLRPMLQAYSCVGLAVCEPINFLLTLTALDYLGKKIVVYDPKRLKDQSSQVKADCVLTTDLKTGENSGLPMILLPQASFKACFLPKKEAETFSEIVFFKNEKAVSYTMPELLTAERQPASVLPLNATDKVVNTVSLFEPDGFVVGVLLPLLSGAETLFYDGRHIRLVPHLCYDLAATVMISTAKVYEAVFSEASPFDFFNLRLAPVVGEKSDDALAECWLKVFGVRLLNMLTPPNSALPVALNTPLYYRFGTYGQPLPLADVSAFVCDDDGFVLELKKK